MTTQPNPAPEPGASAESARTELMPCPFCGGPASLLTFEGNGFTLARVTWQKVKCCCCKIETETVQPGCKDVIAIWNTRANVAVRVSKDGKEVHSQNFTPDQFISLLTPAKSAT